MDPETGEVLETNVPERRLDARGHETLDPNPVEVPVGFGKPDTLAEIVQRLVRHHVSAEAAAQGFESF